MRYKVINTCRGYGGSIKVVNTKSGRPLCECFNAEVGAQIADALNTADEAPAKEEIDKAIGRARGHAYRMGIQGGDGSNYRAIITVLEWATGRELTAVPYYVKPILGIEQEEKP
jgi:hypothetical protein